MHRDGFRWLPLLPSVSMVLGNLAALAQKSVKRLLAYSAIAHAGYILLGIVSHTQQSIAHCSSILTYALTTIGAFGVIALVEDKTGGDKLSDFAGLSRRAPIASLCLLVFLLVARRNSATCRLLQQVLSLRAAIAGTPKSLSLWLVILAIAMSAVSLYYYLQVLKRIYIADAPSGTGPIRTPALSQIILCLIAFCVVLLGCAPNLLVTSLQQAVQIVRY